MSSRALPSTTLRRPGYPNTPLAAVLPALVGFVLLSLGLAAWHFYFSFLLYSETNGGVLINAAWQQHLGRVPYRDYLTAAPPLFLLPTGWAFQLLGPAWSSLSVLVCVFSLLTFAWLFALLWRATGAIGKSLGIAFAIQAFTFLPISWWWYNEVTEVVAALFFASVCALIKRPHDYWIMGSFILAEALLGLGKVNIAVPLILFCVALLFTIRGLRLFALAATAVAIVLDVAFLYGEGISIGSLLRNYSQAAGGRLSPEALFYVLVHPGFGEGILMVLSVAALSVGTLLAILLSLFQGPGNRKNLLILYGIAIFMAIFGMATNNDNKTIDITCLVVLLAFIDLQPSESRFSMGRLAYRFNVSTVGLLIAFMLMTGAGRFEMYWFGTYAAPELRATLHDPPLFRGMRVSPDFAKLLDDINAVANERGLQANPARKIFFGPKLDFCYALLSIREEPGLPLWWEGVPSIQVGGNYPSGSPDATESFQYPTLSAGDGSDPRVQHFLDIRFDLCIFRANDAGIPDMSFFPKDLRRALYENYAMERHGSIVIFTAKCSQKMNGL